LLFARLASVDLQEVEELAATKRGEGGFGSSGRG
jgi:dUTPase